jgi:small Trp-rich protein
MNILGVLGVIFIVLKVLEVGTVATWSWWLVLLPLYGGLAIWFCFAVLFGSIAILAGTKRSYKFR